MLSQHHLGNLPAPFGEPSPCLPSNPHPQLSAKREFEAHGQVFSQRKAEVGAPVVGRQAATVNRVPGLMQLVAGECFSPPQFMGSLLSQ